MSNERVQAISLRSRKVPPNKKSRNKAVELVESFVEGNDETDGQGSKGVAKRKQGEEKRRATFYLSNELYEEVKIHAIKARKDMSTIAQEALALYMSQNA